MALRERLGAVAAQPMRRRTAFARRRMSNMIYRPAATKKSSMLCLGYGRGPCCVHNASTIAKSAKPLVLGFGCALTAIRSEKNLTQEVLAVRADLHRTYLSQLERGVKAPTLTTLFGLSSAMGIKVSQLVARAESFQGKSPVPAKRGGARPRKAAAKTVVKTAAKRRK